MNYENRGESEGSHSGQNFGGSHQNHRAGSREHANGQSEQKYVLPDILEAKIKGKDGEPKVIRISIEKPRLTKPFLGGFKNVKNGKVFHNGFAQTDQIHREHKTKHHRDTQTYEYSTKSSKVMREFGTQVERKGIWIDKREDLEIQSKMYFSSEMWEARREAAGLFIQRLVRGWFARKRTAALKKDREDKRKAELAMEEDFRKKEEIRHKKEIERRMHPRTKDDFNILYEELEVWRINETEKIKSNPDLDPLQKKLALKQLLDKETELLQTIDRLKINASKTNKQEKIQQFLKSMSDPKKWKRSDNRYTEVHTPYTSTAKELMDIYNGLRTYPITLDERLMVLLHTKLTVKEHVCGLTSEIVELIDREADMLNRGRNEGSLEGLRKRLCNLFLQFIETPEYNAEAARFQKIPVEILAKVQQNLKKPATSK